MMHQNEKNLSEVLELADSPEERERLSVLWRDLEGLADEAPPKTALASSKFAAGPRTSRRRLLQAAALFAAGILTGALLTRLAVPNRGAGDASPPERPTLEAALAPHRSAAERLAAVHATGEIARTEPWARKELIRRALRDPVPAIRLAALDALAQIELPQDALERLGAGIPATTSPIVQIRLLDLLAAYRSPSLTAAFEQLEQNDRADPTVRRHAARALALHQPRSTT